MIDKSSYIVAPISYDMTKQWILKRHYAKRMPSVSYAFGLFCNNIHVGIITYGLPATPYLCIGVCGEKWRNNVLELNRLVLLNNKKNEASFFISKTLDMLPAPKIVVSYADTERDHIGYIYQATNWLYTGCTKERTDLLSDAGHGRHYQKNSTIRQKRSAKHRYVYFVGNKSQKKQMRSDLNYAVHSYPKGESVKYIIDDDVDGLQMIML